MHNFIAPIWPAPSNIRAYTTTRNGGYSKSPYTSFNLAAHVDDDNAAVLANRAKLRTYLNLPSEPFWLTQEHTAKVVRVVGNSKIREPVADASFTTEQGVVCTVLTADCLPILLCDVAGIVVAAIHAGWKSLVGGVIENTLRELPVDAEKLLVWFGPAIGPTKFEVGEEVRQQFLYHDPRATQAFSATQKNKWLANIYLLARQRLEARGVLPQNIYGGDLCVYQDSKRFFSYRRDGGVTGRMASLIWISN